MQSPIMSEIKFGSEGLKSVFTILIVAGSSCLNCIGAEDLPVAEPEVVRPSFGIHLASGEIDRRLLVLSETNWSSVKYKAEPVLSDADIVEFDFDQQLMILKPEAKERLPRPDASGTAFVVVADGVPVYLGAFTTGFSSIPVFVPSITVDKAMLDTNLPPNALQIDRGYPGPRNLSDNDPRHDERIRKSLAALKKLKVQDPPDSEE